MNIIFQPMFPDVRPPEPSTAGAAGLDAVAYLENREIQTIDKYGDTMTYRHGQVWIPKEGRAVIPLGFKAQLPPGWECEVRPRSGLALKHGLTVLNSPGTIDSDYPNEWAVILHNTSANGVVIEHGDRVAQLVLSPVYRLTWELGEVAKTTARAGGFGSTGR